MDGSMTNNASTQGYVHMYEMCIHHEQKEQLREPPETQKKLW